MTNSRKNVYRVVYAPVDESFDPDYPWVVEFNDPVFGWIFVESYPNAEDAASWVDAHNPRP